MNTSTKQSEGSLLKWKVLVLLALASGIAFAQFGSSGYGGPTVLSRAGTNSGERQGEDTGFRYFAGVSGAYDSGLTPVSVDQTGKLVNVSGLYGVEGHLGVFGNRRFKHGKFGLDYDGNYREYSQNTYYNGSDHVFGMSGTYDVNKKLTLVSRNSAGSVSRSIGSVYGLVSSPEQLIGTPSTEIFDNRTYFLQTSESFIYSPTARLSYSGGGLGFFVRRRSAALVGMDGYGAFGDIAYRVSRATTVSAAYNYFHIDYPRAFGESDIQQVNLGYARTINKRWQIALAAGVFQVNTVGVTAVTLDPATAALFGVSRSIVAFDRTTLRPLGQVNIGGRYKTHGINLTYSRQPSAGNGVYLTSVSESANAQVDYTGIAHWTFYVSGGYTRLSSIGQTLGSFRTIIGATGVGYKLGRNLNLAARFDAREAQIVQFLGYSRLGSRSTITLDYSPGERPLNVFR